MIITAYTINAFAKTDQGGNPAGIVLYADDLNEDQMKKIAKILGFSETAFAMKSSKASIKVRFFTPAEEVDLCGHATIGLFSFMKEKGLIQPGDYTQETNAGILDIQVTQDGYVMMEQTKPQFFETIGKEVIAESLGLEPEDLDDEYLPQIVSTGLRDIMIPVKNRNMVDAIKPDMEKITKVSRDYKVVGYHVFALDTLYDDTAYCRNFAPLYDIPEESATGTSNGALASYLYQYKMVENKDVTNLVFEQGYSMSKPSEIRASLDIVDGQIDKVYVGGVARNIQERMIELN